MTPCYVVQRGGFKTILICFGPWFLKQNIVETTCSVSLTLLELGKIATRDETFGRKPLSGWYIMVIDSTSKLKGGCLTISPLGNSFRRLSFNIKRKHTLFMFGPMGYGILIVIIP